MIDGGAGIDLLDMSATNIPAGAGVHTTFETVSGSLYTQRLAVYLPSPYGPNTAWSYGFESLILTPADDVVGFGGDASGLDLDGLWLEGAEGGPYGDTLDFSALNAPTGVSVNLETQIAGFGPTITAETGMAVTGFENAIGTSGDDILHGSLALNHLVGGAGNDSLYAGPISLGGGGTASQTRDGVISLTLAKTTEFYYENNYVYSPVLQAASGYGRLDFSDADILEGGAGDDNLYAYPLPAGVAASDTNYDGSVTISDRVLMMGGTGNDTYNITPGTNIGPSGFANINIYDGDGTGRIFVGDFEVSNQLLEGWYEGENGQGEEESYYSFSNFEEIVEGWHVGYYTGTLFKNGDLYVWVTKYSDPNLPEYGPPRPEYGPEDDEDTVFIIRDFRPGDFGISFGIFFEGVFAGENGPQARVPSEIVALDDNGSAAEDTLNGTTGGETINGNGGDDVLVGGLGADKLNGGEGTDWASYAESSVAVAVSLATGTGSGGDAAGDILSYIERLEGSAYGDSLAGDDGSNWLAGRAGNDELAGNAGTDTLNGGAGADILNGGTDFDWAYYVNSSAAVTINLETGAASGGEAAGDSFISVERIDGSAFNDSLTGDTSDNWLRGRAGIDTLIGGNGNDTLEGGVGADVLNGGGGTDWARFTESTAGVTVNLVNGTGSGGEAAGDTLTSIERLDGSEFADILTGASGVNWLRGRGGADVIKGGTGNDVLFGGAEADIFKFAATDGHDEIRDFEDGLDRIDFSATGLTFANLTITANAAGHAVVGLSTSHDITIWNAAGLITADDFIFTIA